MGFEVVLDQHDFLDLAKVFVGDLAQHVSVIDGGSLVGHLDLPPAFEGREDHEEIGGSTPLILVIATRRAARLHGDRRSGLGQQLLGGLIQADQRFTRAGLSPAKSRQLGLAHSNRAPHVEGPGGAESHGARRPGSGGRTSDSGAAPESPGSARRQRPSRLPPNSAPANHPSPRLGNRDSSRSFSRRGSGGCTQHGQSGRRDRSGSGGRPRATIAGGRRQRSRRCNRSDHGRNSCRSRLAAGSAGREADAPSGLHHVRRSPRIVEVSIPPDPEHDPRGRKPPLTTLIPAS